MPPRAHGAAGALPFPEASSTPTFEPTIFQPQLSPAHTQVRYFELGHSTDHMKARLPHLQVEKNHVKEGVMSP